MLCDKASGIGVVEASGRRFLAFFSPAGEISGPEIAGDVVQLRVHVERETATYAYSRDEGRTFVPIGSHSPLTFAWWKAARPALYCYTTGAAASAVDVDWVRVRPNPATSAASR